LAADSFDEDEVLEFVNDRLAWSKLSTATTGDGAEGWLRHAAFLGLRDDKPAQAVRRKSDLEHRENRWQGLVLTERLNFLECQRSAPAPVLTEHLNFLECQRSAPAPPWRDSITVAFAANF
jgi:hypothetical protein